VQDERKPDHEHDERCKPDGCVHEDVLERWSETEVVSGLGEVLQADELALVSGKRQRERVDHRQDAERHQERQVGHDEAKASSGVLTLSSSAAGGQATFSRDLRRPRQDWCVAHVGQCEETVYPAALAACDKPLPNAGIRELNDFPATRPVTTVFDQTG